jgi:hypothetical protein
VPFLHGLIPLVLHDVDASLCQMGAWPTVIFSVSALGIKDLQFSWEGSLA